MDLRADDSTTPVVALGGFGAFLWAVAVVLTHPTARGYEISVYRVYPVTVWLALAGAIFAGVVVLLRQARPGRPGVDWRVGAVLMLLPELLVVSLPLIRGYHFMGRGDPATHLGIMHDIMETGRLSGQNIYPALHDLGVSVHYLTGLPIRTMVMIVPPLMTLLYFGGVVAMVFALDCSRRKTFVIMPFVLLLGFGTTFWKFTPFTMSTLMLPLVLYLYLSYRRDRSAARLSVLTITLVGIVLYHPLTTLYLIGLFLIVAVVERRYGFPSPSANAAAIEGVGFSAWYFGFVGILVMISNSVYNLVFVAGESQFEEFGRVVVGYSPRLADVLQIALLRQGITVITAVVVGAYLGYLGRRYVRTGSRPAFTDALVLVPFICFSAISVVFFFFELAGGYGRPLLVSRFFGLVAAGSFVSLARDRVRTAWARLGWSGAVSVVVTGLILLSIFGMYHSPLESRNNHQLTAMEVDGGDWLFTHRNESLLIDELGVTQYRLYDIARGWRASGPNIRQAETRPPDHFGYADGGSAGSVYPAGSERYVLISALGRALYPVLFTDYRPYWRFTPSDFDRLPADPAVAKIYANGEFETYLIRGHNETLV